LQKIKQHIKQVKKERKEMPKVIFPELITNAGFHEKIAERAKKEIEWFRIIVNPDNFKDKTCIIQENIQNSKRHRQYK
jgi:hypothetical protein